MRDASKSAIIIEALDDILAHKIFATSPKAQDFLRYIITESLAGREQGLTGITIAQDVYAKDENFDSIQDSVVRVTARRVRYMLQDYYAQHPTGQKVKISIPKGKYRPHFEHLEPQPVKAIAEAQPASQTNLEIAAKPHKPKILWAAGLLAAFIFAVTLGLASSKLRVKPVQQKNEISAYPSIAIIPFTNQTDDNSYDFLRRGLQKQMTEDLSRFSLIRPIAHEESYETLLTEKTPLYDYAITGVMLGVEPEIDLYVKLIDLNKTDVIFEDRIRRAPGQSQYYDALFNIVSELSGNFAGLEGIIVKERLGSIQDKIAVGTDALFNLSAFECNSLIDTLLEAPSPDLYKTIYTCLETLLEKDPNDDMLLASFGWITCVGATSHEPVLMARTVNPNIDAGKGFAMIERAINLNPENAWAQQTISSIKIHKGDIQGALEHAEMAVLENPANPDNLSWLGLCLAHADSWDRAMSFAQEAIDRNPDPASQYYYTFFLKGLHDNDAKSMANAAETLTAKENYYAKLYSYLAAIADNDEVLAKNLKPHIDEMAKRNDDDIMAVISVRMPSKDLQQKAEELLIKGESMLSAMNN